MQPRVRLAFAWSLVGVLAVLAFAAGRARRPAELGDTRASTFLAGPDGARALADALERLGVNVERWRKRLREFAARTGTDSLTALALLDPGGGLEPSEVALLVQWQTRADGGDLVLVGDRTDPVMQCFGWVTGRLSFSPLAVNPPGRSQRERDARISLFLEPDSSLAKADPDDRLCEPVLIASIDTLLVASDGRIAAIRLHRADVSRSVLLLSDPDLVRNRTLRETSTGPLVLSFIAGRYQRVVFDEASQGFGTSGSLSRAVLEWSRRSPWGWAVWQVALIGLLALLFEAVRFGPVREAIVRRRRSPLEHVQALATALSAARGHDVAIAALVRGLRRRLAPGIAAGAEPGPWLKDLVDRAPTPRAREQAAVLLALATPGQSGSSVLRAAHAVEDLWEEMHR